MGDKAGGQDIDARCIAESLADPQRFAAVFERHAGAMHGSLARRVEASVRDDLLSEIFIIAFRTRGAYDTNYPDARPWLFGIAVNVVRHHRLSEGRRLVMVGRVARDVAREWTGDVAGDDLATAVVGAHGVGQVGAALARLAEKYRDVLTLAPGRDSATKRSPVPPGGDASPWVPWG